VRLGRLLSRWSQHTLAVHFPVDQELHIETSSRQTARSAILDLREAGQGVRLTAPICSSSEATLHSLAVVKTNSADHADAISFVASMLRITTC
jgi:hypothetical protein